MTNRTPTVVWGAVVVFATTLGAIVALSFAVEDGARLESLVGLILPAAGTLLIGFLALDRVAKVSDSVDRVEKHTSDLTNGLMDSKIRAAVAQTIRDQYLDPTAAQLLEADRTRVAGSHHTPPPTPPPA